jgi:predicted transcriptional regulator
MEIRLTPDEEARLAEVAAQVGSDPEQLVRNAALSLLSEDSAFRAAVIVGVRQADCGELIDETEMDARVARIFQS